MITKYEILEQEKYIEYNGIIKTYGIAYKGENETKIIEDISDDISEVEDLVKILNEFEEKQVDILIGTQMVAKGLDFENVTLVGVISADTMLHMNDYRSGERTFTPTIPLIRTST